MAVDPVEPSHEHLVGTTINGKYRLLRLLGAGGMGAVYEAEDPMLRRRVALKLMKEAIATHEGLVQRFVREARAADAIQHPNIVRVIELARDTETQIFYIVQELLIGENLSDRLEREGRFSCEEALTIMSPILDALGAAHDCGILHRDVKPENVFLHQDAKAGMVPKLIDFGISKMNEAQPGLSKTQTGTALGTPYYMSPEQVRGDSNIDARADLWSAAVMMFELITGKRPFRGENYNILILRIMTDRAPTALSIEPSVPTEVSAVIERALDPSRDNRYRTAAELKYALQRAVEEAANRANDRRSTVPLVTHKPPQPLPATPTGTGVHAVADVSVPDATMGETLSESAAKRAVASAFAVGGDSVLSENTRFPSDSSVDQEPNAGPAKPKRAVLWAGLSLFVLVSVASVVRISMRPTPTPPTVNPVTRPSTEPQATQHTQRTEGTPVGAGTAPPQVPPTTLSPANTNTVANTASNTASNTATPLRVANGAATNTRTTRTHRTGDGTTTPAQNTVVTNTQPVTQTPTQPPPPHTDPPANPATQSASSSTGNSGNSNAGTGTGTHTGMQRFAPITNYP